MVPPDKPKAPKQTTRRTVGRIDWSPETDLGVFLVPRSGDPVILEWSDISVSGAKVVVPNEFAGDVAEGAPIRLRFGVEDLNFRINGRVIWSHPTEDGQSLSVGVHFAYLDPTIAEAHPELWVYFNRRRAFRVTPPLGEEILVTLATLAGPAGTETVRMVDISATGISVTLPQDQPSPVWVEEGLGHKYELCVTLLPEHGELRIITRAERRFRQGKLDCWGMSILEEDERHLGDALESIEEYVTARQREMRGVEG